MTIKYLAVLAILGLAGCAPSPYDGVGDRGLPFGAGVDAGRVSGGD
ncbi:MAG: hypothetical protein AAF074_10280 [Pseudomonadota bacterium]